jgi:hypothetical protein
MNPLTACYRATNDQNGIVTPDGAEYVSPALPVEGGGDGLSPSRNGAENEHFADTVDAQKKLWQQSIERRSAFFDAAVGDGVPGSFRRRNAGQTELPEITGESCLGHVPPTLKEQLAKVFLTADDPGADDLQNGIVSLAFVGHKSEFSTTPGFARAEHTDH